MPECDSWFMQEMQVSDVSTFCSLNTKAGWQFLVRPSWRYIKTALGLLVCRIFMLSSLGHVAYLGLTLSRLLGMVLRTLGHQNTSHEWHLSPPLRQSFTPRARTSVSRLQVHVLRCTQPFPLFLVLFRFLSIFIDDVLFGSRYDVQLHGEFFELLCPY